MHWSQERFHADVTRAVGGTLNLIRELSRIAFEFDDTMPVDWLIKRTQFFAYELQSELETTSAEAVSERDRLAHLNRFFFDSKRFQCLTEMANHAEPSEAFRLSHVLTSRRGSPVVLSLLYAFLAERIGVKLDFIDFNPAWFLRWSDQGRSRYIDVARNGATLSSDELIDVLHSRYQMTTDLKNDALFEPISFDRFMVTYVCDLKSTLLSTTGAKLPSAEKLLFLQNLLIAYQPSNVNRLAERAVLYRRVGQFKNALQDLKRYFAFNDKEKASPELTQLHADLVRLIEIRAGLLPDHP